MDTLPHYSDRNINSWMGHGKVKTKKQYLNIQPRSCAAGYFRTYKATIKYDHNQALYP